MNIKVKFNLHSLFSRRFLLSVSLLCTIMLVSSCFTYTFNDVSLFTTGAAVDKIVNNESELRATIAGATLPTVIILNADISLKESLVIRYNENITLRSADKKSYKLTSWTKSDFTPQEFIIIVVSGVLTLDGITVTHAKGVTGRTVIVNSGGTLIMNSGEISGNTAIGSGSGSGVMVYDGRIFEMYGGKISSNTANTGSVYNEGRFNMFGGVISNNKAVLGGGGVYNDGGIFSMSGGVITNNTTTDGAGGGVYNYKGTFNISGGMISNNTAVDGGGVFNDARVFSVSGGVIANNKALESGGGVNVKSGSFSLSGGSVLANNTANLGGGVAHSGSVFTMFDSVISDNSATSGGGVYIKEGSSCFLNNGVVSNNRALGNGGGVWFSDYISSFNSLFVAKGVVFSNNHASAAHSRNKIHDTIYSSQIKGEVWSKPFTNGYNNYDISYVFGTPILFYNVTVRDSYAELTGEDTYISGALVTINAGTREGYTFSGWTVKWGGVTLLSNTTTTTFTMPTNGVIVTANWTVDYSTWIHIGIAVCVILVTLTVGGVLLHKRSKKRKNTTV